MTIIQFRPSSWEGNTEELRKHNQTQTKIQQQKYDSCEFVDYELTEEDEQGLFAKLKNFFYKNPQPKNSLSNQQAYERARNVLCHAIISRDETAAILEMTTGVNRKQYLWKLFNAGIDVRFTEDDLGRGVMLERDLEGNLKRATTYYKTNNEIVRIEEAPRKGRGVNRISFFDSTGTNFEVKKNMTSEKTMREFYSFEFSQPIKYCRGNCQSTSNGIVAKEEYIF